MGLTNLVWIWYPEQFWEDGYNFIGIAHEAEEIMDFTTFLIPNMVDNTGQKQPVLMAQVAGEFARKIESMTNEEIANRAHQTLRKLFPSCPPAVGLMSSKWGIDPYSRGSWTYFPLKNGLRGVGSAQDPQPEMFIIYCCGCMNYYCCKCYCMLMPPTPPTSSIASTSDQGDGEGNDGDENATQLTALDRSMYYAGEAASLLNRGTAHGAFRMGQQAAKDTIASLLAARPTARSTSPSTCTVVDPL